LLLLLLHSPAIYVLNDHAAATLTRSTPSIFVVGNAEPPTVTRHLPFLEEGKVPEVPSETPGDGPLKSRMPVTLWSVTVVG